MVLLPGISNDADKLVHVHAVLTGSVAELIS